MASTSKSITRRCDDMTDSEMLLAAVILTPMVVVAMVAMIRGYHLKFWLYRPERHDHPHSDHHEED